MIKKRIVAMIMAVAMITTSAIGVNMSVYAEVPEYMATNPDGEATDPNGEATDPNGEVSEKSGSCGDNLKWVLDEKGTLTISGTGKMDCGGSYRAPWYDYKEQILKIIIEQDVTNIEEEAFYYCNNLTEVQIASSVSEIGKNAFQSCYSLISIKVDENNAKYCSDSKGVLFNKEKTKLIMAPAGLFGSYVVPESVTSIEDYAFYCSKLKSLVISENVKYIGSNAIRECRNLQDLTIMNGVVTIGDYAFGYCTALKELVVPNSVTDIGEHAFWHCEYLEKAVLSQNLKTMGEFVFAYCFRLKEINIPNGIESISPYAFRACESLTEITLPESVKIIGHTAFYECNMLKSVVIPNEVTSLGRCAFGSCNELEKVIIGRNVEVLDDQVFYDCPKLKEVKFLGNAPSFVDDYGSFYKTTTTCYYPSNNTSWTEEVRQNYGGTITWIGYESNCATLGHSWSEWSESKAASCTEAGEETRICTVCNEKESREIAKLDHKTSLQNYKEATCTEDGYTGDQVCSECSGIIESGSIIERFGHSYEDTMTPATFASAGSLVSICKNCNDTVTTTISQVAAPALSFTKVVYNGSAKKPTVTVKDKNGKVLVNGTDYTVTYAAGRKNVGRYAVTVTLKGNYSGTKKAYFTIVPKKTSSLTSIRYQYGNQIRLSWTKVTGATGYRVEFKKPGATKYTFLKNTTNLYYTKGGLTANKTYYFKVTPYVTIGGTKYYSTAAAAYRTTSIATVKKGAKLVQVAKPTVAKSGTKVKVSWKNIANETGYQISRSTSSTGTNIVATYATTTGKSKLVTAAKGTKYYYKVRAYRTVNGKKIFGAWSPVRSFKR